MTGIAPLFAWYWWVFIAAAVIGTVLAALWSAVFDRRRGREVEHDPQRPGPRRPEDFPDR